MSNTKKFKLHAHIKNLLKSNLQIFVRDALYVSDKKHLSGKEFHSGTIPCIKCVLSIN